MLKVSESCVHCGACSEVCPAYVIEMQEGTPVLLSEKGCIRCGHCQAVCPTSALVNELLPEGGREVDGYTPLDPAAAELFLRSRRSVRCFKEGEVPQEEVERLLRIGTYAQAGSNSQGVSYLVLSGREKMEHMREMLMSFYQSSPDRVARMLHTLFAGDSRDRVLRGAPMCVFALTEKGKEHLRENARFALTYVELYAPSLGLGTCWAGFLERYATSDPDDLRAYLQLPEDKVISGALLMGYPKYRYHRLVGRDPLSLVWR